MMRAVTPRTCVVLALLGTMLATGCYAVPPLRVGAGGGGGAGQVVTRRNNGERHESPAGALGQLRLAVAPIASIRQRQVDVAVGWALDGTAASNGRDGVRHGPYLEVDWFALRGRAADHQRWRFAPTLTFETHVPTLDDDEDTRADEMGDRSWGFGGSVGVLLEYVELVSGQFLLGVGGGELGMGLAARVGVRHEDGGTHGYGLVSAEFRFPAAAGAVIPLRGRASLR
jgi:hypothetical protein